MPAEDQAAATAAMLAKTGVQVTVEVTATILKALAHALRKHVQTMPEQPRPGTKQSIKRLQWVARSQGSTVDQRTLEGIDPDDPRLKQFESIAKRRSIPYNLERSKDGVCCISFIASSEQMALEACKEAGLALGQDTVDKIDTPSEKRARAAAAKQITRRTTAQRSAEPALTIRVRARPYDLRAGIIKENLDREKIPNTITDDGRTVSISIRQGDAKAVKTLIDTLAADQQFTHFDTSRVENYDQLAKAATQSTPVQVQDQKIVRLLTEQEKQSIGQAAAPAPEQPEDRAQQAKHDAAGLLKEHARDSRTEPGKKHLSRADFRTMANTLTRQTIAEQAQQRTRTIARKAKEIHEQGPTR